MSFNIYQTWKLNDVYAMITGPRGLVKTLIDSLVCSHRGKTSPFLEMHPPI